MKHFAIVAVLVGISTFLVNTLLNNIGLLPIQASVQAITIDRLFGSHILLISFLFSLIIVFITYSLVVFRRKKNDNGDGAYFRGNTKLEVIWTIIPLGLVLYFALYGSQTLADVRREDPQALVVNVTAGQWFWSFNYPDYGITSKSLYLPVNRQVLLKMTSQDVIHDFWVPEFRVKQDILPGKNLVKELRITPDLVGNYKVICAQLCGGAHAYMTAPVIVQAQSDFDAWVKQQVAAVMNDPVSRGAKWAAQFGCASCHSVDGSKGLGPTWKGLYNSDVTLSDNTVVKADDAYIINSILRPADQVVQGFAGNVMPPTYSSSLNDQQIQDLIAYMKTLK